MTKRDFPNQLSKDVQQALKDYHVVEDPSGTELTKLVLVQARQQSQAMLSKRLAVNAVLDEGLTQLSTHQPEGAQILSRRFRDNVQISSLVQELDLTVDQIKHKQKDAFKELAKIIWKMNHEARIARVAEQKSKLEAKRYTELFGIDLLHSKLFAHLTSEGTPWTVTLAGIGGIGKTALANYTVRRVIEQLQYHDVIWLTINEMTAPKRPYPPTTPQQTFDKLIAQMCRKMLPALSSQTPPEERLWQLQQLLKSQPYLIVIDDLELKADTAFLISELVNLANPSRFLLTSRTQPAPHAGSQSISLPELTQEYSLALIRHYADEIGFTAASQASDEELLPIYQLVGGNPFSLKHLVNLALHRPLKSLLVALEKRPLEDGDEIYKHILHETWLSLSENAKTVLAIMTLATEGGMDPDEIADLSDLPDAELWPAINELIGRSLLEVRSSTLWERSYGIHRLTELFLRSLLGDNDDSNAANEDGHDDL
ncbi:MAG: NB-ARC domain-containing protein [Chloroflexota bacterium]